MLSRLPFFCRLAVIGALVVSGGSAHAQLAAGSPFLPQGGAAAAATTNGPLEYGGYLDTPAGERLYRINDPARKLGAFFKLGERHDGLGVLVRQSDDDRNTLTVEHDGKTVTLERRKAKIVSAGPPAMVMPPQAPVAAPNVASAVTQSVVVNPTPADEQRRLEAVAAEVARRRTLREQAGQQFNQSVQPVPAQMPVQNQQRMIQQGSASPQTGQQQNVQRRGGMRGSQQR